MPACGVQLCCTDIVGSQPSCAAAAAPHLLLLQDVTATKGHDFEDYFLKRELLMGIYEKVGGLCGLVASLAYERHMLSHSQMRSLTPRLACPNLTCCPAWGCHFRTTGFREAQPHPGERATRLVSCVGWGVGGAAGRSCSAASLGLQGVVQHIGAMPPCSSSAALRLILPVPAGGVHPHRPDRP